jgi:hypothetical protein
MNSSKATQYICVSQKWIIPFIILSTPLLLNTESSLKHGPTLQQYISKWNLPTDGEEVVEVDVVHHLTMNLSLISITRVNIPSTYYLSAFHFHRTIKARLKGVLGRRENEKREIKTRKSMYVFGLTLVQIHTLVFVFLFLSSYFLFYQARP